MIAVFLRSMSILIKRLVAESKAVHVTEADAAELELLAGLFEQYGPITTTDKRQDHALDAMAYALGKDEALRPREVTPADIARGWLWMSKPHGVASHWNNQDYEGEAREIPVFEIQRAAVCAELAAISAGLRVNWSDAATAPPTTPHHGAKDGAKAVWEYIVRKIDGTKRPTRHRPDGPDWWTIIEKYERELEAMR